MDATISLTASAGSRQLRMALRQSVVQSRRMTTTSSVLDSSSDLPKESEGLAAAPLGLRTSAYLIDSMFLLGFVLAMFTVAGLVLWISSDFGANDPPDAGYYSFIGIFIGGTLLSWSVFNLGILTLRGKTPGQYLIGLQVTSEDGQRASMGRQLIRWSALHPLLFHPLLIPVWALLAAIAVSLTLSQIVFGLTLGLVALCVVAPVTAVVSAVLDHEGRALHDRASGTFVTRAGE